MTNAPDCAVIERIAAAAISAPSADNCQPWSLRWNGSELAIGHDAARAAHVINHGNHLSHLSLGCVLEAVDLAARREGLTSILDGGGADAWVRVRFTAGGEADELVHELPRRATDRRLFRGGSPEAPVFADVLRDAARAGHARAYVNGPSEELSRYVADADAYSWRHAECYRDFIRWVRFSRAEIEAHRDGIPWNALGIDLPALPGMRIARSSLVPAMIERTALVLAAKAFLRRQLASSGALVCFTVTSQGDEALVSAGRLAFRTWLRLTRAGYGVQPLTNPAIHVYNLATSGLHPATRTEFVELFRGGGAVLRRAFGYPDGELPVWIFRAGLSEPVPDRLRAPHRRVEDVLSVSG